MKRRELLKGALISSALWTCNPKNLCSAIEINSKPAIRRVLVMFKCHFDLGFTDTQENVIRTYYDKYYPTAMQTAQLMRNSGEDHYRWTTGSWLLYTYLEQASSEQRRRMDKAIVDGDITWHALPFSWQSEMLSCSMIEGSLGLSKSLDARYGRETIGAKMTDVPCHTRGLIQPLAEHDIRLLDIGVNPASKGPEVPAAFLWKNPRGQSLLVFNHARDYGGIIEIPGSDLAIAIKVRGDNSGNYSQKEITTIYEDLRKRYPQATVRASDLNEIAVEVERFREHLPVVTDEIGDTWIYGVPSDPIKICRYRELTRLRQEWIAAGKLNIGDPTDLKLLGWLITAPEHTWGTDTLRYLDNIHFKPQDLVSVLDTPGFQTMAISWKEKRDNLDAAVNSLPPALKGIAEDRLQSLLAVKPTYVGLAKHPPEKMLETRHWVLGLDGETGAITRLYSKGQQREWADAEHPLALFVYQTLSKNDYEAYLKSYVIKEAPYAYEEFGKPGFDQLQPQSKEWYPRLRGLWSGHYVHGQRVLAELAIDNLRSEERSLVAWPKSMYLELLMPDDESAVYVNYSYFNKQINRLPEAMWLSFTPRTQESTGWTLDKVNQPISPFEVVRGGNRYMHAVSEGVHYKDKCGKLGIEALDTPVVAIGMRSALYFTYNQPDPTNGLHFCLFTNSWGTNYIQWFGESVRSRFVLRS